MVVALLVKKMGIENFIIEALASLSKFRLDFPRVGKI